MVPEAVDDRTLGALVLEHGPGLGLLGHLALGLKKMDLEDVKIRTGSHANAFSMGKVPSGDRGACR